MKKHLRIMFKALIVISLIGIPTVFYGQTTSKTTTQKNNNFESYWYLNLNAGINQMYGDIQDYNNPFSKLSDETKFAGGIKLGRELSPIFGIRGQALYGQLKGARKSFNQSFLTHLFAYNLSATVNINNLFGKYNPDRLINTYGFAGIGFSNFYVDLTTNNTTSTIWKQGRGISSWTTENTVPVGLGANIRLNEKLDLNIEGSTNFLITKKNGYGDRLDGVISSDKNDVYDYFSVGLTYKFKSAASSKKMAKDFSKIDLATTPSPLVKKGDSVEVTIKGTFPPKYFNKGVVMNFAPVLKYEGGETAFPAKNFKGEEATCDGEMVSYKNGGSFVYTAKVPYDPAMESSELYVEPVFYNCEGETFANGSDALANAKKAAQAESMKVGEGTVTTDLLLQHNEVVAYAPNGYEKVTISTQESNIYYPKNKSNIRWSLKLNKDDDNNNALKNSTSDVAQGWVLKDITINGWASPEGEETFNEGLSQHRADVATNYIKKQLKKQNVTFTDDSFVMNGNGPDWNGFMNAVKASDLKDKNAIINVVNSADESKKEEEIRNMILIYPELERDILPPLRRANIKVNAYVPKKTDAEMAELATSDYSKLDVHEILYAATLTEDLNTKKQIYANAMQAFPKCWTAVVNAAAVELELGNNDEAVTLLMKAKDMGKATDAWQFRNNMGIAQFRKGDVKHAEGCFSKAQELGGDENYNLGALNIVKGNYATAASQLSGFNCDYNLGLAQLLNEDYAGADKTLGCANKTADTYYLLAVSSARQDNKSAMLSNLGSAVKENGSLKAKAAKDRSFIKYFNDADFQALIK